MVDRHSPPGSENRLSRRASLLIALFTSIVKVQHRGRSPSNTVCRNGGTYSFRQNCWFSHAETSSRPPTYRTSTTPSPNFRSSAPSQRFATTWCTPRHRRPRSLVSAAGTRSGHSPPSAAAALAQFLPALLQPSGPASCLIQPSCTTSSESSPLRLQCWCRQRRRCNTTSRSTTIPVHHVIDAFNYDDTSRLVAAMQQRRPRSTTPSPLFPASPSHSSTSTSSSPPASRSTGHYLSPRSRRSSPPWRPPPPPPPTEFPIAPPPTTTSLSPSPL